MEDGEKAPFVQERERERERRKKRKREREKEEKKGSSYVQINSLPKIKDLIEKMKGDNTFY